MILQAPTYAAIRRAVDDPEEFTLPTEMSSCLQAVHLAIEHKAKTIIGRHKANPVQRIAQIAVTEVR